jgi:hypothetical protein
LSRRLARHWASQALGKACQVVAAVLLVGREKNVKRFSRFFIQKKISREQTRRKNVFGERSRAGNQYQQVQAEKTRETKTFSFDILKITRRVSLNGKRKLFSFDFREIFMVKKAKNSSILIDLPTSSAHFSSICLEGSASTSGFPSRSVRIRFRSTQNGGGKLFLSLNN